MTLEAIKASNLAALSGIRHGFFSRKGGLSTGIYQGLNCGFGSDDDATSVRQNRDRVARHLGLADGERLITLYQVHSAECVTVTGPWPGGEAPRADAMISSTSELLNQAGLGLGILSADCGPVLFADAEARVVGAAHAGWQGALNNVLAACVGKMCAAGATVKNIHAALGPTIAQPSYEVGGEFRDRFINADPAFQSYFAIGKDDHFQFDLHGFIAMRLEQLELAGVELTGHDTYSDPERFFSYRRTTHLGEVDYGRAISAITLV